MANDTPAGHIVWPAKNGRTKVVRVNGKHSGERRWSDAAEKRFLVELAQTCNVTMATEAAGFTTRTVYARRAKWPAFAEAWREAIATGYARLEARLVELATDSLSVPVDEGDAGAGADGEEVSAIGPRMTVAEAISVLRLHRAAVKGETPKRNGWRRRAPDADAMRASILRKIDAIERAEALAEKEALAKVQDAAACKGEGGDDEGNPA